MTVGGSEGEEAARRVDWRSYDQIAGPYDRVWGARFLAAARHLVGRLHLAAGERLLDVGTGTGAIPAASEGVGDRVTLVGIDISSAMLARARARLPRLLGVAAEASRLPFRGESFDVVTFGFVLSHLREYPRALREARRVLRRQGRLGAANWGPIDHPAYDVWRDLLGSAVGSEALARAVDEVAPWEGRFGESDELLQALHEGGFETVKVDVVGLPLDLTVWEFLDDRELSAGGRYARQVLGQEAWKSVRMQAFRELERLFGARVSIDRRVLLAVGTTSL